MTFPLALSKSGYMSEVRCPYLTCEMNNTLLSSGENLNPSIPPSYDESCFRSLPSGFISHICILPLAAVRKAILLPPFIHVGSTSLSAV